MLSPLLFGLTVASILAMPGPTNTLLATGGATVGLRRALPLALAEALGYGLAILAIGLVLARRRPGSRRRCAWWWRSICSTWPIGCFATTATAWPREPVMAPSRHAACSSRP
ncbi:hypothetical protein ACS0X5_11490 [Burkholderia gladioli]|uniref:hypothetical protein n=1 Tax=Burkholderia gladioli TaxID=28095 RepID=UPI003F7A7A52